MKDVRHLHSPMLKTLVVVTKTEANVTSSSNNNTLRNDTQTSLNYNASDETDLSVLINFTTTYKPNNTTALPPCSEIVPNLRECDYIANIETFSLVFIF